ncbi:MAG: NAD-dependent epimerase/dehydratase family protein [Actinomycetota bacterium]|nr:NAD-dependent epimerase/dehydratase family protein [Actinomycetota bacterium]
MARRAFLLGGSGQTGRALAPRLLEQGWEVVVGSRGERPVPEGVEHVALDRADTEALRAALGTGVDALVDFVAFEPAHAEQLLSLGDLARSLIVLSSGSVYTDAEGRTFDEAKTPDQFPHYPVPINERRQPTVAPGDATYSTRKAAIEQSLLGQDDVPATLIRAGAIYGPGGHSREWYFVKRILDRRPYVILGGRGQSRFHTVSTENLAELIWLAAERSGRRVLNAGDPDPPTLLEISRAVAAALEHEWTEVLLPTLEEPCDTPWSGPRPFVMDMSEAELELGYRPVTTYERAVVQTCEWLVEATRERAWEDVLPTLVEHMTESFDYEREDELVRCLTTTDG